MLKQGVIIIATGYPYYGKMAYNLALTIKAVDPDFPVSLAHAGNALNHLSEKQRAIFNQLIPCPDIPYGAKLYADLISPFEKTLYLDADMAWFPKHSPRDLIFSLKDVDFACICEGNTENPSPKYYFWADIGEIKEVYGVDKVYQWRSEVMFFTRTERVTKMFETAREIYATPKVKPVLFGEHIPDELAINIATAIHGIEPHNSSWMPALWPRWHGDDISNLEGLYNRYYALSCGSNATSNNTKNLYNRVVKAAAYKNNVQHLYPLTDKRLVIKERQKT